MDSLSHIDESGASRIVDVSSKLTTHRSATASGLVRMAPKTLSIILGAGSSKGDVLGVARLAGIMAAKRTGELIPLCHPIGLDGVTVGFLPQGEDALRIEATVKVEGKTGVEMEALTAVSIAALTIYDMCKSVDRAIVIDAIRLESKSGGRSGDFRRG
jgi:cyclic pyranopterin phosphate synthase